MRTRSEKRAFADWRRRRRQADAHRMLAGVQIRTADGSPAFVAVDDEAVRLSCEPAGAIAKFRPGPLAGLVSILDERGAVALETALCAAMLGVAGVMIGAEVGPALLDWCTGLHATVQTGAEALADLCTALADAEITSAACPGVAE